LLTWKPGIWDLCTAVHDFKNCYKYYCRF